MDTDQCMRLCKGRFRRAYAGVNASDVNYTAGRYFGGAAAAEKRLPFDAGFESVGVVAALGPGVSGESLMLLQASWLSC